MDEQRQEAYLDLIQTLLKSSSEGEKIGILNANKNLIDAGLLQTVKQLLNTVQLMSILAPKLTFLREVLQATSDSDSDLQVLIPLLLANLDKLDDSFAPLLCFWATVTLPTQKPRQAQLIAKVISDFSHIIRKFTAGNCAINIEIAMAGCEVVGIIFTREDFPVQWAANQINLGITYSSRIRGNQIENLEMAIAAYEDALQVYTREAFPRQWAMAHANLAKAYSKRVLGDREQNLEQAIYFYKEALKVFTCEAFPEDLAIAQNHLSLVYRDQGQLDQAIECFRSALDILTPTASPLMYRMTGDNLGNLAFLAEQWSEATEAYGVAIESVETIRAKMALESWRYKILEGAIDIYQKMVQACINDGQLEKAVEYVERSRSKRLVDLMASNKLDKGDEIPPEIKDLLQQYDGLQERIDRERSQNDADNNRGLMGAGSSTRDRAAFQAYNEAIANLEAEKQQIWEQLRSLDPVLAGEIQVSAPDFSAMQKLIDQPTTAILSFYTTSNDTYIFVLRQNQIALHTCVGQGLEELQTWISQNWLQSYAEDGNTWKSQVSNILSELAKRLQINHLISQHLEGITELLLVPHLALHQIPFAALPIGNGQYLADKFLIRYTPSCQVLEFCQERGEVEGTLTYGTVEDAEDNLAFASFEGEQIAQLYNIPNNQRLKGSSQATRDNYRQLAKEVQVLHSCHHAESRLDNPLECVLKLADGNITLGQLMTPGWRLPNLSDVFLSCCETGLGLPEITDDILTLSTGFLCAGARSVVSTLWVVDDLATALFSIFYYQHRQQGKSRPEALQQAQIKLRSLTREHLAQMYSQVNTALTEAESKLDQYQPGSADYLEWERKSEMYLLVMDGIYSLKTSQDECPFSHPRFWAAFTCQGLR